MIFSKNLLLVVCVSQFQSFRVFEFQSFIDINIENDSDLSSKFESGMANEKG
jgi:hypothetical protein